ncbi:MAG: CoA-binding protein [Myxococcota bacterium]
MSDEVSEALDAAETIAVIGMKRAGGGAANSVPNYMERHGYRIIPVNPKFDEIDGKTCYPSVAEIPAKVDMVNIFRRSTHVPDHVDEILQMEPKPETVWLQLGIRNDAAAEKLEEQGIRVIQDRCIKVEHARR